MEIPADVQLALDEYNATDAGRDAAIWFLGTKRAGLDEKPIWALGRRLRVHPEVRAAAADIMDDPGVTAKDKHFAFHIQRGLKPTFIREGRLRPKDVAELKRLRYRWVEERKEVEKELESMMTRAKFVEARKEERRAYLREILSAFSDQQTLRYIQGNAIVTVPGNIS